MIKLITTVGTSIFDNYLKVKEDIKTYYDNVKDKGCDEYGDHLNKIETIKKAVISLYKDKHSMDISAEIKSVNKIKEYLKEDVDVYLIATDTIVSRIAADIIKDFLSEDGFNVFFEPKIDVIRGLQVRNKELFIKDGLVNLIKRIEAISTGYYGNVAFNISGGYKANIPYITIMAQINGCDMYYIFEDTEELIRIPAVPINVDTELFERYSRELVELESCVLNYGEWEQHHYEFISKAGLCIERMGNGACLSPLGLILWENYKSRYINFFATQDVVKKMKSDDALIQRVVKFLTDDKIRENKTEIKGLKVKHSVYDDGNNNYRIVYVQKEGQTYIYEIFNYEPDEIKFLNDPRKSNKIEDYELKPYKIDKQSLTIIDD